ncbi:hypothetical protein JCM10213_000576 [Rhodosporidiobolus nylandii]
MTAPTDPLGFRRSAREPLSSLAAKLTIRAQEDVVAVEANGQEIASSPEMSKLPGGFPSRGLVPHLDTKLIGRILSYVYHPADLASCCLVSRTFLDAARPHLYGSQQMEMAVDPSDMYEPSSWAAWQPSSCKFVATLLNHPHLARLVRDLFLSVTHEYLMDLGAREEDDLDDEDGFSDVEEDNGENEWKKHLGFEGVLDDQEDRGDFDDRFQQYLIKNNGRLSFSNMGLGATSLLAQLRNLESLTFTFDDLNGLEWLWRAFRVLPHLHSLEIMSIPFDAGQEFYSSLLDGLRLPSSLPSLRTLEIPYGEDFGDEFDDLSDEEGAEEEIEALREWCKERGVELKTQEAK